MDLADSAITVAKSLYYFDLRDIPPERVVMFDDLPMKYQIRYYDQAAWVLDELTESV